MSALLLELETVPEVTQVDVPAGLRRVRGRLLAGTGQDTGIEGALSESPEPVASGAGGRPSPPKAGRLSELYLRSVEDRKGSRSRHPTPSYEPGRPQLVFARVDDPGLRLQKRPYGFELSGRISDRAHRHERRLAIAFEGELFAVLIQVGDSIEEIIERLRLGLRGRYDLDVLVSGERSFSVSFRECLVRAG